MKIFTDVIDAYMNNKIPKADSWFYAYTNQTAPIASTRQEVCDRLLEECLMYRDFPLWNREIITTLFPDCDSLLEEIILMPIIGAHKSFDAALIEHENRWYLVLDLLNIADYTQSVKKMCYILHNLCHMELLRRLFQRCFPKPEESLAQLNYRFFVEGFVLYLAWNEAVSAYVFHTSAYASIKQKSFQFLYQSLNSEAAQRQRILSALDRVGLWDRFPDIAGMFFCDDVYRRQGVEGLKAYFSLGWEDSAARLFSTPQEKNDG